MSPLRTPSHVSRVLWMGQRESRISTHSPAQLYNKGDSYTVHGYLTFIKRLISICFPSLHHRFINWTRPSNTAFVLGTVTDLARTKSDLVEENALLRKPLIILRRQIKRPACMKADRILLVLLARMVRTWKQALFIVQPGTLLRWHRQGFRLFWKYTSRAAASKPKIAAETVALIKAMAEQNRRLRCGADPWRIAQAGHSRVQADHSEVHEAHSHTATGRTELDHLLAPSCQRDVGRRLSPSH